MAKRLLLGALLALTLCTVTGCGFIDYFLVGPPEDTAQELFEAGVDAMHAKEYGKASDFFSKLKDRYPFSPYTPLAELGLGDALFMNEKYQEAVDAYKEFETMHPTHEETPYALYQIGVAYFKMFQSIDLPMANIQEGLEYFYRVEESYPGTKYAEGSKQYVVKCRRLMAEHELFVADFYWRATRYVSAWKRYEYVGENFGDLPDIKDYARRRAEFAYYEYQKTLSTKERERIQGSWKRWFDWL